MVARVRLVAQVRLSLLGLLRALSLGLLIIPLGVSGAIRAEKKFTVKESRIEYSLLPTPGIARLPIENLTGKPASVLLQVELLDSDDRVVSENNESEILQPGKNVLSLRLPLVKESKEKDRKKTGEQARIQRSGSNEDRPGSSEGRTESRQDITTDVADSKESSRGGIFWYRLRYRLFNQTGSDAPAASLIEGVAPFSSIAPELFEVSLAAPRKLQPDQTYRATVQTYNPVSGKPAAAVSVHAVLAFSDSGRRVERSFTTNLQGVAELVFPSSVGSPTDTPADARSQRLNASSAVEQSALLSISAGKGDYFQCAKAEIDIDNEATLLISTDKPLYQPGQTLYGRTLVLNSTRRALPSMTVRFRIKDPQGSILATLAAVTSRFGIAPVDWKIPENARTGQYSLTAELEGPNHEGSASRDISISRYELPAFAVEAVPHRPYYLPGQTPRILVRARYLHGKPVVAGRVRLAREEERSWDYLKQKWETIEPWKQEAILAADGTCAFAIPLSRSEFELGPRDRTLRYAAYVTDDTTGRTEQRRCQLRLSDQEIDVQVLRHSILTGFDSIIYVQTSTPDGKPVSCRLDGELQTGGITLARAGRTNEFGLAKLDFPPGQASSRSGWAERQRRSQTEVSIKARDDEGRTGKMTQEFYDLSKDVRLYTDKNLYRSGEPVSLVIESAQPEASLEIRLLSGRRFISSSLLRLNDGRGMLSLPWNAEYKEELTILAFDPADGDYPEAVHTVLYPVRRGMKIQVQPSKLEYRPGEQASVKFQTRDLLGNPLQTALGVVVLDHAIDELVRSRDEFGSGWGRSRRWYYELGGIAGITRANLMNLDMSLPVPEGIDLLAEVLSRRSNQAWSFFARAEANRHELDAATVFHSLIERQFRSLNIEAVALKNFERKRETPTDYRSLSHLLAPEIDLNNVKDPWGRHYYATYQESTQDFDLRVRPVSGLTLRVPAEVIQHLQHVVLMCAGPDRRERTEDDFPATEFSIVTSMRDRAANRPLAAALWRQAGQPGEISGIVTDINGDFIPGAEVTATHETNKATHSGQTDDSGRYRLTVPYGLYQIRFSVPGFKVCISKHVPVHSLVRTRADCRLVIGEISEAVTVTGSAGEIMTSTGEVGGVGGGVGHGSAPEPPRVRQYFPETLLWLPDIETDAQGNASIEFPLADSITTWRLAVTANTLDGKIDDGETFLKAFQPLFIDYNPPPVLTAGDQIDVPVVVRNYLDEPQHLTLKMEVDTSMRLPSTAPVGVSVDPQQSARAVFNIVAAAPHAGSATLITAAGSKAGDAVKKTTRINPDGEEIALTSADAFRDQTELTVSVPEHAIKGTIKAEIKIYPDLAAHAFEGIESILRRPYGCGEQTISSTYPNMILLLYLQGRGEEHPAVARKALQYLRSGYERLLGYRENSGGFSYWGTGPSDVALTAYAMQFLLDASGFIDVDPKILGGAASFLLREQKADGSWSGRHSYEAQVPQTTATVAAALARLTRIDHSKSQQIFGDALQFSKLLLHLPGSQKQSPRTIMETSLHKGLAFLATEAKSQPDPYLWARYGLAAANAGQKDKVLEAVRKLRETARENASGVFWESRATPYFGWGRAGRLEATALALYCLVNALDGAVDAGPVSAAAPTDRSSPGDSDKVIQRAVQYLVENKDRYGIWFSSHATVNVLRALLDYRDLEDRTRIERPLSIRVNGEKIAALSPLEQRNPSGPSVIDVSRHISSGLNRVAIVAEAADGSQSGDSLFQRAGGPPMTTAQLVTSFYVPWRHSTASTEVSEAVHENSTLRLSVRYAVGKNSDAPSIVARVGDAITCRVEARRQGENNWGMLLAEIGLPPGADVDRTLLEKAKEKWVISQYEVQPDRLIVYLWATNTGTQFDFTFRPRLTMIAKAPASLLYDYYNPEAKVTVAPALFVVR